MNSNFSLNKIKQLFLLSVLFFAFKPEAHSQLNPMGAMYFQNQYMGNPAMAGSETGLKLNLGYRKQWSSIPGSPTIQTLTADYGFNEKVGLGLNIYNDKAGLFKRTRTVASYAYHLHVSDNNQVLSFGVSLGFMNERISDEEVNGDAGDTNVSDYNQRDTYVDGDFGFAYISNALSFQASLPNLKGLLKKDLDRNAVDRSTFFSAISYKLQLSEGANGFGLEPKIAYRGVKGFDNIMDAGANLTYLDNRINLFGMYHSSKSATYGLGINYQSIGVSGMYTTVTSALGGYANGNFEISLQMKLGK